MTKQIFQDIYNLIKKTNRILIMPSAPPDGDSLGSALAMYLILKKMGKEVTVVSAEPIPDSFKFLPTSNVISNQFAASGDFIVTLDCANAKIANIRTKIENDKVNIIITPKDGNLSERAVSFSYGPTNYEAIIVVDAGDLQQLGKFYEDNTDLFTRIPVINIDHHISNGNFGKINLVDYMAPSTTELIFHLLQSFPEFEELIDEDIATLLLAGIITDTGSFQNSNTSPRAFAGASRLLDFGARQQEIIQHVYKTKNLSTLKLWGRVLTKIKTDETHKLVWSTITQTDLAETASNQDETGDIIDELMTNAPGAEIVMLIKEREEGLVSCSIRSTVAGVDANEIAEYFGGGGHSAAAGFRIKSKTVEEAEKLIIEKVREFQKQRLFLIEEDDSSISGEQIDEKSKQKQQDKTQLKEMTKKFFADNSEGTKPKTPSKGESKFIAAGEVPEKPSVEFDLNPEVDQSFEID
jgi:phosphoesterase RecJ-like protein